VAYSGVAMTTLPIVRVVSTSWWVALFASTLSLYNGDPERPTFTRCVRLSWVAEPAEQKAPRPSACHIMLGQRSGINPNLCLRESFVSSWRWFQRQACPAQILR